MKSYIPCSHFTNNTTLLIDLTHIMLFCYWLRCWVYVFRAGGVRQHCERAIAYALLIFSEAIWRIDPTWWVSKWLFPTRCLAWSCGYVGPREHYLSIHHNNEECHTCRGPSGKVRRCFLGEVTNHDMDLSPCLRRIFRSFPILGRQLYGAPRCCGL